MTLLRQSLPQPILYKLRLYEALMRARLLARAAGAAEKKANPLPTPLIVSLTSFPPRFDTLHLTLDSLLEQTVRPDRIILWIAHQDLAALPPSVRMLESRGITIRGCDDIGSYKKLIYALKEFPEAFIATADDDTFYEPRWLETLVEAVDPSEKVIVCHRAHRIALDEHGKIAAYEHWEKRAHRERGARPSTDLLPTGCGGILYPPHSLASEVTRRDLFQKLCPQGDDLWFYWMARMRGSRHKLVDRAFVQVEWPSASSSSLWAENSAGGNDRQVGNLEDAFGNPLEHGISASKTGS